MTVKEQMMAAVSPSYELTEREGSSVHEITEDSTSTDYTTSSTSVSGSESESEDSVTTLEGHKTQDSKTQEVTAHTPVQSTTTTTAHSHSSPTSTTTTTSTSSSSGSGSPVHLVDSKKIEDVTKKPVVKLMTQEERGEGAVGWSVYQGYFQAANKPLLLVCLVLSFVLGE